MFLSVAQIDKLTLSKSLGPTNPQTTGVPVETFSTSCLKVNLPYFYEKIATGTKICSMNRFKTAFTIF
jgi:hypothetical protein